jgi:hypothetical protein
MQHDNIEQASWEGGREDSMCEDAWIYIFLH